MNLRYPCFLAGGLLSFAPAASVAAAPAPAPAATGEFRPRADEFKIPGATRYRWEQVPGESLALIGPYGTIWRLNFGARATKPHFHPLQTVDGRGLAWGSPPDHPWHYGLWHAWKLIDGVNYWEEKRDTGLPDGITRIVGREVLRADGDGARVRLRLEYAPRVRPDDVVLEEMVDLVISLPREDGSYLVDWYQTSRARRPVVFERTPPPVGGYAGLSFRASRFMRDVTITGSTGATNLALHHQGAAWAMLAGNIDGRRVAVTMFDHSTNPRHPTPWYVVHNAALPKWGNVPFWYLNAAFIDREPLTLQPAQPLRRFYRVRIDREAPESSVLEAESRAFHAQPIPVP
jgi:hypothetical protein